MQTIVTTTNMVTIPVELSRKMGITPGCRLDWKEPETGSNEIRIEVMPSRAELAKSLFGRGAQWSPERDSVAELVAEREDSR